jgi:molecular chaperone Hsp33
VWGVKDQDRLIQGMAGTGDFRVIAVKATAAVEAVRQRNDMSPVASIALGRAMAGALLLARLLDKGPREHQVTLRIEGDGPLGLIIAEANTAGTVRGFVANPRPSLDSLEVGRAVGRNGTLLVVRAALPTGRPYASQIRLVTGEIARDLSEFLLVSEQISTAVLLGVQLSPTGVEAAGGMVVQRFPHATEEQAETIESLIEEAPPFSSLLARMPLEDAVGELLRGTGYRSLDPSFDVPVEFRCSCTRQRALAPYALLASEEITEMIEKEGGSSATCQFCGETYQFTPEELRELAGGGGGR